MTLSPKPVLLRAFREVKVRLLAFVISNIPIGVTLSEHSGQHRIVKILRGVVMTLSAPLARVSGSTTLYI